MLEIYPVHPQVNKDHFSKSYCSIRKVTFFSRLCSARLPLQVFQNEDNCNFLCIDPRFPLPTQQEQYPGGQTDLCPLKSLPPPGEKTTPRTTTFTRAIILRCEQASSPRLPCTTKNGHKLALSGPTGTTDSQTTIQRRPSLKELIARVAIALYSVFIFW